MIYKNSLKSEQYRKNYSSLVQKQYSITRIYDSLEWVKYPVFSVFYQRYPVDENTANRNS